jgi:hypothetical protein
MYDGGKVITGLIIGIVLLAFPLWWNLGAEEKKLDIKLPQKEKKCVEPNMRPNHMQVLDLWRDSVVRTANRYYINDDGRKFEMSLQNTCMSENCHARKTTFCDQCHDYAAVDPYCWDCHIPPKEPEPKETM